MCIGSKLNTLFTLDYMINEHENKYFDRKSAQIRQAELASLISAFANANGGTIIIGISDKKRILEGINVVGEDKINEFLNAPKDCCRPMPRYKEEFIDIINYRGEKDRLLLLHIDVSIDQIIRTSKDETYLRIGDKTREMLGDNLKNLEYSKSTRHYEEEINEDAQISDLDTDLLSAYKEHVGSIDIDTVQLLKARGFIKTREKKQFLTNAAVLLFAKNIRQFYPNCRIRFVRYDGVFEHVGMDINIIRDYSIETSILKIIEETKNFISSQLREFTALDSQTGRFKIVPEYPDFAWLEGIVNAVTHREYAMNGQFIKVTMYDDRLEIESPGKLPNIVTVNNIKDTRYSRNPVISRVLTEFGWVRELNEGVKRIYSDMEKFFLDDPVYIEDENSVKLILKNNIVMRERRKKDRAKDNIGLKAWEKMDELEKNIVTYMLNRGAVKRIELERFTNKSSGTIRTRLKHLMSINVVKANGKRYDPNLTYELTF